MKHPIKKLSYTTIAAGITLCTASYSCKSRSQRESPLQVTYGMPLDESTPASRAVLMLQTLDATGKPTGYFSSGSLIASNLVLTCGHCVATTVNTPERLTVGTLGKAARIVLAPGFWEAMAQVKAIEKAMIAAQTSGNTQKLNEAEALGTAALDRLSEVDLGIVILALPEVSQQNSPEPRPAPDTYLRLGNSPPLAAQTIATVGFGDDNSEVFQTVRIRRHGTAFKRIGFNVISAVGAGRLSFDSPVPIAPISQNISESISVVTNDAFRAGLGHGDSGGPVLRCLTGARKIQQCDPEILAVNQSSRKNDGSTNNFTTKNFATLVTTAMARELMAMVSTVVPESSSPTKPDESTTNPIPTEASQ